MLSLSDRRTLASAKANFTRAIQRGSRPLRSHVFIRKKGETILHPETTQEKALAIIRKGMTGKRAPRGARAVEKTNNGKRPNRARSKAIVIKKAKKEILPPDLHVWKHSHGYSFENEEERQRYKERRVITLHRRTRKGQAVAFKKEMLPGDFFYLCHQNRVQLLGQITSDLRKPAAKWPEREYRVIKECKLDGLRFVGPQKKWTPNYNSTCVLVPFDELLKVEKSILSPFFGLRLKDLQAQAAEESITPDEDDALTSLPKNKYVEARGKLVRHKRLERVLVRNRKLVEDAKKYFKAKHGKLFCEGCKFDFQREYGVRGTDFIEAHHSKPIAHIESGTQLKVTDLNMVCPNCHRMLHRAPWITVRQLRKEMAGAQT